MYLADQNHDSWLGFHHRAAQRPGHPVPDRSGLSPMSTDYSAAMVSGTALVVVLTAVVVLFYPAPAISLLWSPDDRHPVANQLRSLC